MLYLFNRLKKIILIITIIFITGCTAKYEVTINDAKSIEESLNITEEDTTLFDESNITLQGATPREYLETNLNWPTPIFIDSETNPIEPTKIEGVSYYNQKDISTDTIIGINYNYKFKTKEYSKSNILNTCYEYKAERINDVFTFKTTSDFKCFDTYKLLDKVQVHLKTNCKVINNNSDTVRNNTYIWNITKDNIDKKINFSVDCTPKTNTKNSNDYIGVILAIAYMVFILFGIVILKISYHNKNKF